MQTYTDVIATQNANWLKYWCTWVHITSASHVWRSQRKLSQPPRMWTEDRKASTIGSRNVTLSASGRKVRHRTPIVSARNTESVP